VFVKLPVADANATTTSCTAAAATSTSTSTSTIAATAASASRRAHWRPCPWRRRPNLWHGGAITSATVNAINGYAQSGMHFVKQQNPVGHLELVGFFVVAVFIFHGIVRFLKTSDTAIEEPSTLEKFPNALANEGP
tara:strand:- start:2482 stop:2889 length:408 start_codon:yes stop_codon:yes gene_type:complete